MGIYYSYHELSRTITIQREFQPIPPTYHLSVATPWLPLQLPWFVGPGLIFSWQLLRPGGSIEIAGSSGTVHCVSKFLSCIICRHLYRRQFFCSTRNREISLNGVVLWFCMSRNCPSNFRIRGEEVTKHCPASLGRLGIPKATAFCWRLLNGLRVVRIRIQTPQETGDSWRLWPPCLVLFVQPKTIPKFTRNGCHPHPAVATQSTRRWSGKHIRSHLGRRTKNWSMTLWQWSLGANCHHS